MGEIYSPTSVLDPNPDPDPVDPGLTGLLDLDPDSYQGMIYNPMTSYFFLMGT
jgi:hypothetical protein